ncbi:MAG: ferritin-like domain-containing protein [Chitinophagales bacterium]|nr:ferritin-like domain-containing protein [Bacteroidota bacterium]MBP8753206.1 ferritin-like domain-containing protein [Chitinophagales bacterium]MBP9188842.1 ferritin-like domain-containing protein [Chitinophagales bacterium]
MPKQTKQTIAPTKKTSASSSGKTTTTSSKKTTPSRKSTPNDSMLEDFFYDELKDIYWAEKHLTKALPKLNKAATSKELKNAFSEHLEVTKTHIERLEQVFELLDKKAVAKKCEAMEGLTKEADSIVEDTEKGTATRDVGLILAAQKVEHYEIATYGGLAQLARTLKKEDVAELLEETLGEEKEADSLLTDIAENDINYEASQEEE